MSEDAFDRAHNAFTIPDRFSLVPESPLLRILLLESQNAFLDHSGDLQMAKMVELQIQCQRPAPLRVVRGGGYWETVLEKSSPTQLQVNLHRQSLPFAERKNFFELL